MELLHIEGINLLVGEFLRDHNGAFTFGFGANLGGCSVLTAELKVIHIVLNLVLTDKITYTYKKV